jgi:hypothetical protein
VPDVAVDAVLLGLVEDFVPSAGVEPVVEHTVTVFHVAGDQRLNRGGLAADRVVGPRDDRDWKIGRNPFLVLRDPEAVEPLSAHRDDAEFGHRFLVEEARHAGEAMAERTAWRICSQHRLWSVFGKKRGKNGKVGPPVHDDLVERDFTTESPNLLWLADITEHPTREGKLYLCAIKDVFLSASWATASTPG